ncbi:MAG: NAD(P)-dependent alcohol dehydrogenase [Deltaproteobacteria bacterium]|nr:NAD(P)-dependent alcohol dehydrogenase [Deltaproteobacteria bacterium]
MKAIVYQKYGEVDVLKVAEVKRPIPKDHEVLVEIAATTVTPVDCAFRGGNPWISRLFTGVLAPKNQVLGTELAGEVMELGKNVQDYRVGDLVYASPKDGFGAHAEYICLDTSGAMAQKPNNISVVEAASIPNGALTALSFLRDIAKVKPGQKVLINGASGSIGCAAVQLAKVLGAEVTGVCSAANLLLVKSLGADAVLDYAKEDFTLHADKYDVIFDTVGKSSFSKAKNALTSKGVFLVPVISIAILLTQLWTTLWKGKRMYFAATGLRKPALQAQDLLYLNELIKKKQLTIVVDRIFPFEDVKEAYQYVSRGHKVGNVVLEVSLTPNLEATVALV